MAELSKRWIIDADIIVDYKNKKIRFENEKSLLTRKAIALRAGVALFFCIPFMFLPNFETALFAVVCVGYTLLTTCFSAGMPSLYRRYVFKIRRRRKRQFEVANPEGVITYETKHVEPLIDVEYSDDVGDALTEISLRKETRGRTWIGIKRKVHVLTIRLSRRSSGTLKIIEF